MADDTSIEKGFFTARKIKTFGDLSSLTGESLVNAIENALSRHQKIVATGNKKIIQRSKEEMQLLAKMVRNGTADVGSMRDNILTTINNSIIQTETAVSKISELQENTINVVGDSIKSNLPSIDTILGAISISNPLFGFGLSVIKSISERSKESQKVSAKQSKELNTFLEKNQDLDEDLSNSINKNNDEYLDKLQSDEIINKLDSIETVINDQTKQIIDIWDDGNKSLEKIKDTNDDLLEIKHIEQRDQLERDNELEQLEQQTELQNDINIDAGKNGILDGIMGLYFFKPIRKLFNVISKGIGAIATVATGFLAGVVGLISAPLTLFLGAAGLFADGWLDASKILGKEENQLSTSDKVAAGLGRIVGVIGNIVDWFTSLLGIDLDLGGFLTTNVAQLLTKTFDFINTLLIDSFEFLFDTIPSWIDKGISLINSLNDKILSFFTEKIPNFINEKFDQAISNFFNLYDNVDNLFDNIGDFSFDVGKRIKDGIKGVIEPYLPDKDGPLGFINDLFDWWNDDNNQIQPEISQNLDLRRDRLIQLQQSNNNLNTAERVPNVAAVIAPQSNISNNNHMWTTPLSSSNNNNIFTRINDKSMM